MAERKGDTKSTLLDELESIKGLLVEEKEAFKEAFKERDASENWPLADDDIPILREVIEAIEPADPDRPSQPSLFTDSSTPAQRRRPPQPTRAEGENPFLPAHIRARLQGNQPPPLLNESEPRSDHAHARIAEPQPAYGPQPQVPTRTELVEAVIAELRPELEARLRARLEPLSQDVLLELLTAGDDDSDAYNE